MTKEKDLILSTETTLDGDMEDSLKKEKLQKMLDSVIKASSFFNGYNIHIQIKSYWQDKKS